MLRPCRTTHCILCLGHQPLQCIIPQSRSGRFCNRRQFFPFHSKRVKVHPSQDDFGVLHVFTSGLTPRRTLCEPYYGSVGCSPHAMSAPIGPATSPRRARQPRPQREHLPALKSRRRAQKSATFGHVVARSIELGFR